MQFFLKILLNFDEILTKINVAKIPSFEVKEFWYGDRLEGPLEGRCPNLETAAGPTRLAEQQGDD